MASIFDEDSPPLFCERLDWADITPLEQYENISPIAPIFYSEEYKDATSYFRGIVKIGEKSQRVLELTETIIRLNPAHYSAWQYRYETLIAISAPLAPEIALMAELAIKSLKNYQVWHHRRLLVTITREAKQELAFIQKCLRVDEKNYHTWSYRQWILAHFGGTGTTMDENQLEDLGDNSLWEGELDFIQIMLNNDIRNNSAWHHRFFVVWACGIREGEEDRVHIFKRELTYVKQSISIVPNNVAAWNYLRGILQHNARPFSSIKDFITPYTIPSPGSVANRDIVDLENTPPAEGAELPVPAAIEFMADIWEEERTKEGLDKAYELWKSLAIHHDTVRKKYWEYRIRNAHGSIKADS